MRSLKITTSAPFEFGKNSAGLPAISVPCGTHSNGLPMGIQFMSNYFEEGKLLDVASGI